MLGLFPWRVRDLGGREKHREKAFGIWSKKSTGEREGHRWVGAKVDCPKEKELRKNHDLNVKE